jgi:2-dehydropantoate 2-reductase
LAAERSVAVYGAGAVGCYLGGMLGARVTLIGRRRVVDAISARGLVIRDGVGETVSHPQAVTMAEGLAPFDLVILTVRAYDVASSIDDVRGLMGGNGLLLALQNGVGSEEELAAVLGRERVLAGTLTVRVSMDEPGVVTRDSRSGGVALAAMDGSRVPGWVADLFTATGLTTVTIDDYRSLRWSKLLLNSLAAATSAILDMDIAELVAHPAVFRLEQLALREAGRVMDAQGIRTVSLPGYPVPLVRLAMRTPAPVARRLLGSRLATARGGRSPRSRDDMARGRSEIGVLQGAVARAAAELGSAAPVNQALAELVEALVRDPGLREEYRGRPERLIDYMRDRGINVGRTLRGRHPR